MTRAAVALGSNLGDRRANLEFAVENLRSLGDVVSVSDLYETAPVGGPPQGSYLNAVAIVETRQPAEQLLVSLHDIERRRGRTRDVHWAPRTLDLDLLLYGSEHLAEVTCTVPHPRMLERRFVIEPLLNAWPEATLPDGTAVAAFLDGVADQELTRLGSWWSSPAPRTGFAGRGGWWVVIQFVMIGLVVFVQGLGGPSLPGGTPIRIAGVVLAAAGVVQAFLGIAQLGDRLTPFPEPLEGGGIIHGGVYSSVRHPIYGGIVLGLVGLSMFRTSLYGMVLSIVAGGFFWLKSGREEARLIQRFAHYEDYRAGTRARLIPWVI